MGRGIPLWSPACWPDITANSFTTFRNAVDESYRNKRTSLRAGTGAGPYREQSSFYREPRDIYLLYFAIPSATSSHDSLLSSVICEKI